MNVPTCIACRCDLTLITLRDKAGEFARRWKCCRCGFTANAGMVQVDPVDWDRLLKP